LIKKPLIEKALSLAGWEKMFLSFPAKSQAGEVKFF